VFPCLFGVSARAGGVVNLADSVQPRFLGSFFGAVPGVSAESVPVPVCSPDPEPCLCAGGFPHRSRRRFDPFWGSCSRVQGGDPQMRVKFGELVCYGVPVNACVSADPSYRGSVCPVENGIAEF